MSDNEPTVIVPKYLVLPSGAKLGDLLVDMFTITVSLMSTGLYSVVSGPKMLTDGRKMFFDLDEALDLARRTVDVQTVKGVTWEQWRASKGVRVHSSEAVQVF